MQRGFTLIEVVLALVLFQFGMLALAATIMVAAGDVAASNRRDRARALAERRVALLGVAGCPSAASGRADVPGGLVEHWHVRAEGPVREIVDSVALTLPRQRTASVVVRAWALCE